MDTQDRGQTALDFAVAIGVFILAVAFMLAFVPSMFAPFFGMGAGDGLVADRSAAYLAENKFAANPNSPGTLDADVVGDFFDDCDDGAWLAAELGVGTENIQVSIDNLGDILDNGIDDTCGSDPSGAETVSNRIVSIDGQQTTLRVVVW